MSSTPRPVGSVGRRAPLEGRSVGAGAKILSCSEDPTVSVASLVHVVPADQGGQCQDSADAPVPVNDPAMNRRPSRERDDTQKWEQMTPADLHALLRSLPVIEQSKGILMGYYGVDADTAFRLLRRWSSIRNIKLRTLSAAITEAAGQPDPKPYGSLQSYLHTQGLVGRMASINSRMVRPRMERNREQRLDQQDGPS